MHLGQSVMNRGEHPARHTLRYFLGPPHVSNSFCFLWLGTKGCSLPLRPATRLSAPPGICSAEAEELAPLGSPSQMASGRTINLYNNHGNISNELRIWATTIKKYHCPLVAITLPLIKYHPTIFISFLPTSFHGRRFPLNIPCGGSSICTSQPAGGQPQP